jgi:hypothetical protein
LDPIAVDATELAKPYARHMEFQCTVRDASGRAKAGGQDEPLVPGYWVLGAYVALKRMLGCVVCAGSFLADLQRQCPDLTQELEREGVLYTHHKDKVPCYRLARGLQALALRHDPPSLRQNA